MGEDLKAIQDALRGVRGWLVVLEGKAAGVWTGVKPLAALKLVKGKNKRLPPHRKAGNLTEALAIWFVRCEDWLVVGAGRDLIPHERAGPPPREPEAYLAIREIGREGRRRKEAEGSFRAPPLEGQPRTGR